MKYINGLQFGVINNKKKINFVAHFEIKNGNI